MFGELLSAEDSLRKTDSPPLVGGLWLFGTEGTEDGFRDDDGVADIVIPTLVKVGAVATAVDMINGEKETKLSVSKTDYVYRTSPKPE